MAVTLKNDYSFPAACTIHWKFAAKGNRPPLDLFWYDGSIKPPTPEELETDNKELQPEGMLFVGESGKILAGFRGENPQIIPENRMREYRTAKDLPEPAPQQRGQGQGRNDGAWVAAFKGGKPTYGDFLLAGPITDAFNLGAVSLRLGGRKLLFDAANMRVTNLPEANKYLGREYRAGWELTGPSRWLPKLWGRESNYWPVFSNDSHPAIPGRRWLLELPEGTPSSRGQARSYESTSQCKVC